jgi:hypothetical protein
MASNGITGANYTAPGNVITFTDDVDVWGTPVVAAHDTVHTAYRCNNYACHAHPAHMYGNPCVCPTCVPDPFHTDDDGNVDTVTMAHGRTFYAVDMITMHVVEYVGRDAVTVFDGHVAANMRTWAITHTAYRNGA